MNSGSAEAGEEEKSATVCFWFGLVLGSEGKTRKKEVEVENKRKTLLVLFCP